MCCLGLSLYYRSPASNGSTQSSPQGQSISKHAPHTWDHAASWLVQLCKFVSRPPTPENWPLYPSPFFFSSLPPPHFFPPFFLSGTPPKIQIFCLAPPPPSHPDPCPFFIKSPPLRATVPLSSPTSHESFFLIWVRFQGPCAIKSSVRNFSYLKKSDGRQKIGWS